MGFYIQSNGNTNKGAYLENHLGATRFNFSTTKWEEIPTHDLIPVIVVQNGFFDAAGICYSQAEYEVFTDPSDRRPRQGYLLGREIVIRECPSVEEWLP